MGGKNFAPGLWSTVPMKLSRRLRSLAACLALFGVLFAQVAVASHACPGPEAMAVAAMDPAQEPMPCCGGDGTSDPQPALCAAHCQQGDQSLDKPATPLLPVAAIASRLAAADLSPAAAPPPGRQLSLLSRSTEPPLALRHCCLRI